MKNIITAIALLIYLNTFGQSNVKTYSGEMKTPKDILGKLIENINKGQVAYSYYELEDGGAEIQVVEKSKMLLDLQ